MLSRFATTGTVKERRGLSGRVPSAGCLPTRVVVRPGTALAYFCAAFTLFFLRPDR
jgi:hypothetical protein